MFSLLAGVSATISSFASKRFTSTSELALYIDAATFLYTAWVVYRLQSIPRGPASASAVNDNVFKSLIEGFKFVAKSKVINGLIFGMLGAFFAAGAVIGLARTFVGDLNAGDAAYGILFAAVFTGLAIGIWAGPKIFAQFSRRRIFGAALTVSSFFLVILSSVSNMVLAILLTVILGAFAGLSWVTGFTMLGLEVDDEVRGRIFAFVQSLIRISLVLVLAISPIIAAAIGRHTYDVNNFHLNYSGAAFTMFGAGIIGMTVGIISYRRMKDRPNISFFSDIRSALRGELSGNSEQNHKGTFIAFEGGEASGKSTQADLLKEYLESTGEKVVLSREPGGTPLGNQLRQILLDPATGNISPRSEALLYAADRANHVFAVIKPALENGDVVISDRYMDSSIAYQGAGRILQPAEVARISRWATESLMPNLTIVMDLPADVGLSRLESPDRLEQEPLMFHERVRREFLNLANMDPERYFIVDATLPKEEIAKLIADRVSLIPLLQTKRQKSVK
jgi:dTMP kinase